MSSWLETVIGRRPECWTPKLVGSCLIDAVGWARRSGGPVGPASMRGSMPAYNPTLDDHLDEGWGLPEAADGPEDERALFPSPPAGRVTFLEAALEWPARYLYPDHEGSARMLGLWVRCKVSHRPFDDVLRARYSRVVVGEDGAKVRVWGMSRSSAYDLRTRGLSLISQGLDRDGVPLP